MAASAGDTNVKELMKRFGGFGGTKNPIDVYSEQRNQKVKKTDVSKRWTNAANKINNICVLSKADQMLLQRRHSEIAERKAKEEAAKNAAKYKGSGSTGLLYDTTRKLERERLEAERKARQDIEQANAHLKGSSSYSKMEESARLERQRIQAERKAREDYVKRTSTVHVAGDFQYQANRKKRERELAEKKARDDASKAASKFKAIAGLDKFGAEMRRLEAEKREAERKAKQELEDANKKYNRGVSGSLQAESARIDREQKMREKKAKEDYERAASHYKGGPTKQDEELKKLTRDARIADAKAREEARKAQTHYKGGLTKEIEEVKKLTTEASKADAKSREEALKAQANYKGGITKQYDVIRQEKENQLKDKKAIEEAKNLHSKFRGAVFGPAKECVSKLLTEEIAGSNKHEELTQDATEEDLKQFEKEAGELSGNAKKEVVEVLETKTEESAQLDEPEVNENKLHCNEEETNEEADEADEVVIGESENEEDDNGQNDEEVEVTEQAETTSKASNIKVIDPGMVAGKISNAAATSA